MTIKCKSSAFLFLCFACILFSCELLGIHKKKDCSLRKIIYIVNTSQIEQNIAFIVGDTSEVDATVLIYNDSYHLLPGDTAIDSIEYSWYQLYTPCTIIKNSGIHKVWPVSMQIGNAANQTSIDILPYDTANGDWTCNDCNDPHTFDTIFIP